MFEAEQSRILHLPREAARNAVVQLLNESMKAQRNQHIARRTGLDSRVVAANMKKAGERTDTVRSRLVGCAVTSSWTGDGKCRCLPWRCAVLYDL